MEANYRSPDAMNSATVRNKKINTPERLRVNACLYFLINLKKEAEQTIENEAVSNYRDFPAQRLALERILQKLSKEDLPGKPYLEQYFRHLHRLAVAVDRLPSDDLFHPECFRSGQVVTMAPRGSVDTPFSGSCQFRFSSAFGD